MSKTQNTVIIRAPWAEFAGEVAGVQFSNGRAEVASDYVHLPYFERHGYGLEGVVEAGAIDPSLRTPNGEQSAPINRSKTLVADLRTEAEQRGLSTDGTAEDLRKRLAEADENGDDPNKSVKIDQGAAGSAGVPAVDAPVEALQAWATEHGVDFDPSLDGPSLHALLSGRDAADPAENLSPVPVAGEAPTASASA